ncbi:MAG: T9SS type A sorting domain-containing protein [Chitinophagales bacterium]|nr:T9SS type A sorting domain-containing protein [Chitinophagales bacterium]
MKFLSDRFSIILLAAVLLHGNWQLVQAQCTGLVCNGGNCLTGDDWYLVRDSNVISEDFVSVFPGPAFENAAATNLFIIKDIPMAVYGPDKMYDAASDKTFFIDLYFPKNFYTGSKKYPVIVYMNGGGFLNTNKEKLSELATRFAAKGFVVATFNYRTGRLNDSTNICGGDASANQALFRAIQDCRVAMRTVKAIGSKFTNLNGDYHYDLNGAAKFLYLPFIDVNRMIIGGESAGAVTALTTVYYDACDIDESINNENALSPLSFSCGTSSTYTCGGMTAGYDFIFDEQESSGAACKVDFFFPASNSNYLAAPVDKIKAVINVKGGVPEHYLQHCTVPVCPENDEGCFGCAEEPFNLNAKYVANSKADKIPMIAFHGIIDATVPYYHRYQSTYEGSTELINYSDLDNQGCRPFTCTGNNPFPSKGFLFGSRKIYQRLQNKGVCAALFGEAGADHTFDGDGLTRSFIATQTTLFIKSLAFCGDNCQAVFDEDINWSADAASINLSTCMGKIIDVQVTIANLNPVGGAAITSFQVQPFIFKEGDPGNNLINFKKMNKQGPYAISGDNYIYFNFENELGNNFIGAGSAKTITLKDLITSEAINASAGNSYTIGLRLRYPDGSFFHSYTNCSTNVPNELPVIEKSGFTDCLKLNGSETTGNKSLVIYPNPSAGEFIISFSDAPVSIWVSDLQGSEIESWINPEDATLNLGSNYPNGLYLLYATFSDGTILVKKLVKSA